MLDSTGWGRRTAQGGGEGGERGFRVAVSSGGDGSRERDGVVG